MKKTRLTCVLLMIIHISTSYSQCVNEVSTHPDAQHTEKHKQSLPKNNGQPDERFLNGWYWWYNKDPQSFNAIPLNNMGLNPGQTYGSTMQHFNADASSGHYYYLSKDYQEVMLPENGWEILADNRGWYPDFETDVPMNKTSGTWTESPELRSIPYLLFYNKYTGIARVFARYGNNEPPQGTINVAEISIVHPDDKRMSGILRLGDGYDRTLDQNSIIQKVSAVVPAPGSAAKWFSADFQLAFDPCVCNYESEIELKFEFMTQANIKLHGGAFTTSVDLLQSGNLKDQDFLGTFDNTVGVDNGYMIYKAMDAMVDDYLKRMVEYKKELDAVNKQNKEIDKNLATLKIAKTIFVAGITAVTGMPEYSSLISLIPAVKAQKDHAFFGKDTQKAFWKELDKVLGLGFDLLMKENFTKKDKPEKPSMPTATATEMRFSGNITYSTNEISSSIINTPGSFNANTNGINLNKPQRYPTYNEHVGVFALLETPQILMASIENCIDQGGRSSIEKKVQLSIANDLKYTFNSALKIKDYDIQVAIVVKENLAYSPIVKEDTLLWGDLSIKGGTSVNIQNTFFGDNEVKTFREIVREIDTTGGTSRGTSIYNTIFVPINAFKNFVSESSITYNGDYNYSFNCTGLKNFIVSAIEPEILYVDLKILLNVTYEGEKSDGTPHEYTYVFTYRIPNTHITHQSTEIVSNLKGSSKDITQYPENLRIKDVNFNGQQVEGCRLNTSTNTYTCRAWNDVVVEGSINI
jgi:hypothetical protein